MKCRELKINSIEIINALQYVDYQLVKINTTDYCWITHTNIYNILGNEFTKINNNYNNRDLVLKFPYISRILKGIFSNKFILWYNLTGVRNICSAMLTTIISPQTSENLSLDVSLLFPRDISTYFYILATGYINIFII